MVERSLADRDAREAALDRNREALGEATYTAAWVEGFANEPHRVVQELCTAGASGQAGLTAREQEILPVLALGLSHWAIGEKLFITERRVEGHVGQLFRKLGVQTRAAAIAVAAKVEPQAANFGFFRGSSVATVLSARPLAG